MIWNSAKRYAISNPGVNATQEFHTKLIYLQTQGDFLGMLNFGVTATFEILLNQKHLGVFLKAFKHPLREGFILNQIDEEAGLTLADDVQRCPAKVPTSL